MRMRLALVLAMLGTVAAFGQGVRQFDARVTFEAAKKVESIDGDLKAAADMYRKVSESTDRSLATQANLRLAAIYRKLGDAPAQAKYEALARGAAEQGGTAPSKDVPVTSLVPLDDTLWAAGLTWITPDGRYLSRYSRSYEIFITDLSSGRTERLPHSATAGMISPDGRRVAMIAFKARDKFELQVVDRRANATPATLVTTQLQPYIYGWSYDSKSILVTLVTPNEGIPLSGGRVFPTYSTQLAMVSVDGGRVTPIGADKHGSYVRHRPNLSPDGRYIAYSAFDNPAPSPRTEKELSEGLTRAQAGQPVEPPHSSVYIQAVDGSAPKEVVTGASHNESPVWTPDGRHLLFLSDRSGMFKLYSVAVENGGAKGQPSPVRGSQIAEAVTPNSGTSLTMLGVTRDGTFYYAKDSEGTDVYRTSFGPDGRVRGSSTRLSNNFENQLSGPAYSPTGDRIAFLRRVAASDFRVVVRDLTSGRERLYQERFRLNDVSSPVWMPDGRSLLLQTSFWVDANRVQNDSAITKLELETEKVTSNRIQGLNNRTSPPAISPNGETVYFLTEWGNDIRALDLGSGNVRSVWTAPAGAKPASIALSPDGRTFAVAIWPGTAVVSVGAVCTLARVGVDGTGYKELGKAITGPGLAWTPDGQAILYRDDNYRLMRMPVGGTPQFTGLTVFGFSGFSVRPSTGSEIAFGQETRPELWKMEKLTSVLK